MGVGEAVADLCDQADDFCGVDMDSLGGVEKGVSVYELHHDEEHSVDLAEVIHTDEVGVVEAGHGFGFGFEAGAECCVFAELVGEYLDGDLAIQ